jgi:uncharacterized repeat protein (TIGR03803 family)
MAIFSTIRWSFLLVAVAVGSSQLSAAVNEKIAVFDPGPAPVGQTLATDGSGNLYVSLTQKQTNGKFSNAIFKLSPRSGGGWSHQLLFSGFAGYFAQPSVVDAQGNLYGTTFTPGGQKNCGIVFELSPAAHGLWAEKTLHSFPCFGDGASGELTRLIFDSKGNLYGTSNFDNFIFELRPGASGQWNYSVIYTCNASECGAELGPFDAQGNLYGAGGEVFELSPHAGAWTYKSLYTFNPSNDGNGTAGMVFDASGNLFGVNSQSGQNFGGSVFELSPNGNGGWNFAVILNFVGLGTDGSSPTAIFVAGPGQLVGATLAGGAFGLGTVFTLDQADGTWTESLLHSFQGSPNDGDGPGELVSGPNGNYYGLAQGGVVNCQSSGCGVIFEITQ